MSTAAIRAGSTGPGYRIAGGPSVTAQAERVDGCVGGKEVLGKIVGGSAIVVGDEDVEADPACPAAAAAAVTTTATKAAGTGR